MTSTSARLAGEPGAARLEPDPRDADLAAVIIGRGDRIVQAAYELLADDGLEGMTVRAVLKRAGVNRRTFYERFSGKDDLVLAVFEQSLQVLAAECRKHIRTMDDPLDRLRFIISYIIPAPPSDGADPAREIRRSAALCREHMRLAEARPSELRRALMPFIALLAEELRAAIARGQVRKAPPERLAAFVYNLVSTTVHAEVLAQEAGDWGRADQAQLADDLWAFCCRGLGA